MTAVPPSAEPAPTTAPARPRPIDGLAGFSMGGLVVPFANYWWFRPILEDICIGGRPNRPADDTVRLVSRQQTELLFPAQRA